MWDKIKQAGKDLWAVLAVSVGALVLGLVYMLRKKQDENSTLKAEKQLNEADKATALLDKDIEQKQKENAATQAKIDELDNTLSKLEEQRKTTQDKEKARPDDQVEDYWKNH